MAFPLPSQQKLKYQSRTQKLQVASNTTKQKALFSQKHFHLLCWLGFFGQWTSPHLPQPNQTSTTMQSNYFNLQWVKPTSALIDAHVINYCNLQVKSCLYYKAEWLTYPLSLKHLKLFLSIKQYIYYLLFLSHLT